jgi:octaprenyl-diphosphate synthase
MTARFFLRTAPSSPPVEKPLRRGSPLREASAARLAPQPGSDAATVETPPRDRLIEPIRSELAEVEQTLDRELRSEHPFLHELSRYGAFFGGKRLRPTLLLLCGKAAGTLVPAHVTVAAAIEMIHAATLVHDDVLDDATTRRRLPTVNARWNDEVAVLMGDYLFSHAFRLAASSGSAEACRIIGAATNATCAGELKQVSSRGDLQLSESDYFEIVEGKTAALLACCGRLGGELARAGFGAVRTLERFGRDLGVVFQIVDDLLDVCGDPQTLGKNVVADLGKGKLTLPAIKALARATGRQRTKLLEILDAACDGRGAISLQRDLTLILEETGGLEEARRIAEERAERARRSLDDLPASTALDALRLLPDAALNRKT